MATTQNSEGMTRRKALAGFALAPIASALPISAVSAASTDRRAWNVAMCAFKAAEVKAAAAEAVFTPIHDRCRAEIEEQLPHRMLPPHLHIGKPAPSTADYEYMRRCRREIEAWDAGKVKVDEYVRRRYEEHIALCRDAVKADADRKTAVAAIESKHGYPEAGRRWEDAEDARYDAEWALMDMPSPDLPALLWKLEKLLEIDNGSTAPWSNEAVEQTVADCRRLLGGGRA